VDTPIPNSDPADTKFLRSNVIAVQHAVKQMYGRGRCAGRQSRIDIKQSFVIWEKLVAFAHLLPDPLQFDTSVIDSADKIWDA
jgi:hypothetical protein